MLKVQTYLKTCGLARLTEKYSIKVTEHVDGRILLNYDQIKSPKTAEITRECRGLCLKKSDYSLVARSFRRFFNYAEWRADLNKFNWNDCFALAKEDGTLISLYWYADKWQVQTRGSFGDIPMYDGGPTFEELFWLAISRETVAKLDKKLSYTFELCSTHNKVVRHYPEPTVFLLSVFEGERELDYSDVVGIGFMYGINSPDEFKFSSIEEVEKYIRDVSKNDKTYEGIVLRDCNNVRMKVKNPDYLCLHRLKGEQGNLFLPKNLIGFVLDGETEELLCYFKECESSVYTIRKVLDDEFNRLESVWNTLKGIKSRKEFALSIPKDLKTKSLLFRLLDTNEDIQTLWKNSKELLLKVLFDGRKQEEDNQRNVFVGKCIR